MDSLVQFIVSAVFSAGVIWAASKLTFLSIQFKQAVIVAGASALVSLVPGIGWLLSIILFLYLLNYYTDAPFWPDLILMMLVATLISWVILLGFG